MSYRVYIKNDYKPEIVKVGPLFWFLRMRYWLLFSVFLFAFILHGYFSEPETDFDTALPTDLYSQDKTHHPGERQDDMGRSVELTGKVRVDKETFGEIPINVSDNISSRIDEIVTDAVGKSPDWIDIKIADGDNMARLFNRLGLSPRDLHEILTSNERASVLKQLQPGQVISFLAYAGDLQALKFEFDLTRTLLITKKEDKFDGEIITIELEKRVQQVEAIINDSLFQSGQTAGLSDNLIMQLIDIFGWDIDFIQDIRKGDSFKVVFEELYKNLEKVTDGPVLAAEFTNQGRKIRTVRYQREDGQAEYYTDAGLSIRKAFLRNPLKFSRISSHFNLKRKHPVLNRIRAHKGVDYAAPTGTPINVTGDGTIHHVGNKGGYGKTIIVKHGGKYSTLYAHLSRYKKGTRRGRPVKQGQVIGYVGKSGLATGPHLHYEFRVNEAHRNPLTVALPKTEGISAAEIDKFKTHASRLFAMLDTTIDDDTENSNSELLAQTEDSPKNNL